MSVLWFPFGLLVLVIHTSFALYGSEDSVTQLNTNNFESFISQPGVKVVKFYASWCGHCENFAPKFKKAAKLLQGVVQFGVVDNEVHRDIGNRFSIEAYPTILIFRDNGSSRSSVKYTGVRTTDGLVKFLMEQVYELVDVRCKDQGLKLDLLGKQATTGATSGSCGSTAQSSNSYKEDSHSQGSEAVITLTEKNFDLLVLQSNDDWLVAFIAPWCGHCKNLAPEWKRAAEQLKGKVKVGTVDATVHTQLAGRYNIRGFPTIKYFKSDQVDEYQGERSAEQIVAFGLEKAESNRPPPEVYEIVSYEVLRDGCDDKQLCIIAFLPHLLDCQSKCRKNYLSILKEAAKMNKAKDWGWLWSAARTHQGLEEVLQVGGFGYPTMVAINMRKHKFAVMHGPFASEGIRDFLRDLSLGMGSVPLGTMSSLPEIKPSTSWDGKDAPVTHEEEIDLSELGIKTEL